MENMQRSPEEPKDPNKRELFLKFSRLFKGEDRPVVDDLRGHNESDKVLSRREFLAKAVFETGSIALGGYGAYRLSILGSWGC